MQILSIKRNILVALIYSFGLQELLYLPYFEHRLQLTEFLFIGLFFLTLIEYKKNIAFLKLIINKYTLLFTITLLSLIGFIISSCVHPIIYSVYDLITKVYLFIFFLTLICCIYDAGNEIYSNIMKHLSILSLLMTVAGFTGWILSKTGVQNVQVSIFENYPYFGTVHRMEGFTATPSMFISIIFLGFACSLYRLQWEKYKIQSLAISIVVLILSMATYTKSWIFLPAFAGAYLIYFYGKKWYLSLILILGAGVIHVLSTHFMILPSAYKQDQVFLSSPYTNNKVVYEYSDKVIFETCYMSFKKAAIYLGLHHPVSGIGPGNYNSAIVQLKELAIYPVKLPEYDPHCTLLGCFAEAGIISMILVILFFGILIKLAFEVYKADAKTGAWMLLSLIVIILESISMDVLHFRHYWFMFALYIAMAANINLFKNREANRYNSGS